MAGTVNAVARHTIGNPTCLTRSLTLWWMLRRAGIASDLRIGVRKGQNENSIQAHAWIEIAGNVINDEATVRTTYAVFERFPNVPLEAF